MRLAPLSSVLGMAVEEFDAAAPVSHADAAVLRRALDEHKLLCFRARELPVDAQVALLEVWGEPLEENPEGRPGVRHGFVSHVHEDGILGESAYAFHFDHVFMPEPIEVLSLYGVEVPAPAVATRFVDAERAAAELPAGLRARVAGRRARHAIDPAGDPAARLADRPALPDACPHAWHALLRPHPRTGREVLFANAQQTDRVEGLGQEEGRALLAELFAWLYRPEAIYAHPWQPGDLVVWDNQAVQHARDPLDPAVPRTLRRVAVGGTSVMEYFSGTRGPMTGEPLAGGPAG